MEQIRRNSFTGTPPPPPRLLRSRSGTVTPNSKQPSSRETSALSLDSDKKSSTRVKSNARTRNSRDEENRNPVNSFPTKVVRAVLGSEKRLLENREVSIGFLQHRLNHAGDCTSKGIFETAKLRKARSVTSSPSAWALSPGRSTVTEPKNFDKHKSSFLKIFRSTKKDSSREEDVHQLRLLHNRLIQWRFLNAKAETKMNATKQRAETKFVSTWSRISQLRSSVVGKRIQIQKLEMQIKLRQILNSQLNCLQEWERIEKRNLEALARSARVFQAATIKVPLVRGAQADLVSVYRSLCEATDIVDGIGASIRRFLLEAEKISSIVVDLRKIVSQEQESLQELMQLVAVMVSLEVKESSLRAHLLQVLEPKGNHRVIGL